MKKTILLTLALMFGLVLKAGDDPKTLAPAMYEIMKSGKKLDKVFIDQSYDRKIGFKLGTIEYLADNRKPHVLKEMTEMVGMLVKNQSPYTLNLSIVKVTNASFIGVGYVMGRVTVEGKIVDADGKIVAAFLTREAAMADDYQVACEKIVNAIAKDLL